MRNEQNDVIKIINKMLYRITAYIIHFGDETDTVIYLTNIVAEG